jgi:hypothetical protein
MRRAKAGAYGDSPGAPSLADEFDGIAVPLGGSKPEKSRKNRWPEISLIRRECGAGRSARPGAANRIYAAEGARIARGLGNGAKTCGNMTELWLKWLSSILLLPRRDRNAVCLREETRRE